jgi:hypothetical protein
MRWIVGFAVALGIAGHSFAQEAPTCAPGQAAPPPAEFARWGDAQPLVAATTPVAAQRLPIPLGTAKTLALAFASDVRYAARPERPDAGAGKAGMIAFHIAAAGIYRVALSGGAWIEVVRDGKTTKSVAHRHGPDCGTIRKIVDFQLTPGRYILQLSASDTPEVTVMIAKAAAL